MAMAHHALMARLGLETRMLCEKLSNLRLDRLGQQRTRAAAQDLGQEIGEGPWLGELDDVTVGHGVSLLHWRSGGAEHHHDTPPYPVTPSPTSGLSSARAHETFPPANCRYAGSNASFGGMRRATRGADDPSGPGAEQDVGQVRSRLGRLRAIRCCANISRGGRR